MSEKLGNKRERQDSHEQELTPEQLASFNAHAGAEALRATLDDLVEKIEDLESQITKTREEVKGLNHQYKDKMGAIQAESKKKGKMRAKRERVSQLREEAREIKSRKKSMLDGLNRLINQYKKLSTEQKKLMERQKETSGQESRPAENVEIQDTSQDWAEDEKPVDAKIDETSEAQVIEDSESGGVETQAEMPQQSNTAAEVAAGIRAMASAGELGIQEDESGNSANVGIDEAWHELPAEELTEMTVADNAELAEGMSGERYETAGAVAGEVVDRMGNAAYAQKTVENLVAQGRGDENPAEMELQERLMAARNEGYQAAQRELVGILNGRPIEQAIADYNKDMAKLVIEIDRLESVTFFDEDARQRNERWVQEARDSLASMQRRQQMLQALTTGDNYAEYPGTEAVVESAGENEDIGNAELADTTEGVNQDNGVNYVVDIDQINFPDSKMRTFWKIRRASMEQGLEYISNPKLAAEIVADLNQTEQTELAAMEQTDFAEVDPNDTTPVENMFDQAQELNARAAMTWANAEGASAESAPVASETITILTPEERAEKEHAVLEELNKKSGWQRVKRRVRSAALAALTILSLAGCNMRGEAVAATVGTDEEGMVPNISTDAVMNAAGGFGDEMISSAEQALAAAEQMADLTRDTRSEALLSGTKYDYATTYDQMGKLGKNNFGVDKSEFYEDREGTAEDFYDTCYNSPEALACAVTAYPEILKACSLDPSMTPERLDEMFNQEGGGDLQDKLLKLLKLALNDENTKYDFYREYNNEKSYYQYNLEGVGAECTPENMALQLAPIKRNGEKQVKISVPVYSKDGQIIGWQTGDFNMECSYQRNIEYEQVKKPVVKATPEKVDTPTVVTQTEEAPETPPPVVVVEQQQPVIETPVVEVLPEETVITPTPTSRPERTPDRPTGEKKEDPTEDEDTETPTRDEDTETPIVTEDDETPTKDEGIKKKDGGRQQENAEKVAGEGNVLTQTSDVEELGKYDPSYVQTEKIEIPEDNEQTVINNAVVDETKSSEEQNADIEAQEKANKNEITENISDEGFVNSIEQVLQQTQQREEEAKKESLVIDTGVGSFQFDTGADGSVTNVQEIPSGSVDTASIGDGGASGEASEAQAPSETGGSSEAQEVQNTSDTSTDIFGGSGNVDQTLSDELGEATPMPEYPEDGGVIGQ